MSSKVTKQTYSVLNYCIPQNIGSYHALLYSMYMKKYHEKDINYYSCCYLVMLVYLDVLQHGRKKILREINERKLSVMLYSLLLK
jgi:hypothetical protein